MARYIDADDFMKTLKQFTPDRKVKIGTVILALDAIPTADVVDKERYARLLANAIIVSNALKEYQTADFVKVVRCKDCRYSTTMKDEKGFNFRVCSQYWFHGMIVKDLDYCSQGRRDNVEIH